MLDMEDVSLHELSIVYGLCGSNFFWIKLQNTSETVYEAFNLV